jgi:RNA polymerase sigma-70 factor, ECF subfamily
MTDMAGNESFHDAIGGLRVGDQQAATEIYQRYAQRLIGLAHRRLDATLQAKADPESVVQSVFRSFFVRQAQGQFDLDDWDSLWSLLVRITVRKCCRVAATYRAERRDVRREVGQEPAQDVGLEKDQALAREPTPEEATILADLLERLMQGLDDTQQTILAQRLQGYTVREISASVGRTERTVHRVLGQVRASLQRLATTSQSA